MSYENEPPYFAVRREREGDHEVPEVPTWELQENSAQRQERIDRKELNRRITAPMEWEYPRHIRGKKKRAAWQDELKAKWRRSSGAE